MILAPLRGVTVRAFREVFAEPIREAGFTEAITPFIPANPGCDPLKDRELAGGVKGKMKSREILVTPQLIGKDPEALRAALERLKEAGYETADLNCGCPYPMVRSKGRGSGLLKTPGVLERMLAVGCETMGDGKFSVKARLGVERNDELLGLMPMINSFPLRFLTVHARTARQMYSGRCDREAFDRIAAVAEIPLVANGDFPLLSADAPSPAFPVMVGRAFITALGDRRDVIGFLRRYLEASSAELFGDAAVLGRLKELIAYWKFLPAWHRRWDVVKLCRTIGELSALF